MVVPLAFDLLTRCLTLIPMVIHLRLDLSWCWYLADSGMVGMEWLVSFSMIFYGEFSKKHWKKHPSGTDTVGSGSCDRMRAGAHDKAALLAPSIDYFLVYDMN